ncbi:MAG: UDP-3-O-acyl-N-acetylglucosamine deacetylase, partial [Acetobacteraceae bacterium]|nr:UDP-3-O-acyl-N-acetylglucosamine deacetylase [Acetobacteraceae bacterium]
HPAAEGRGVVFRRSDLGAELPARFDYVADTRLCTLLADPAHPELRIGTIEHLLAALAGLQIDNVLVELDGPEVPILDGSAAPFVFLLECAGILEQDAPRPIIEVLRPVRVQAGAAFAELRPAAPGLDLALSIEFPAAAIGTQALALSLNPSTFRRELARARTFALAEEVEQLRQAGLGRGGSLDNAVVVDGARVLNPAGLRMRDEFVRHKLLDVVGDLALAGAAIHARFSGHRSGHALNNRLLQALFADSANWQGTGPAPAAASRAPVPAAA